MGGVPSKTPISILDTDYQNWAIVYACKQRPFRFKNEWVWILGRENTLDENLMAEAKNALRKAIRKFDFDRLVPVIQDDETCKVEEAPENEKTLEIEEEKPVGEIQEEPVGEVQDETESV